MVDWECKSFKRWNCAYLPVTQKNQPFLQTLSPSWSAWSIKYRPRLVTQLKCSMNRLDMNRHVMTVGFYQFGFRLFTDAEKSGSVDDLSVVGLHLIYQGFPPRKRRWQWTFRTMSQDARPNSTWWFSGGYQCQYQCQYQWEFNLVAPKTSSEKLIPDKSQLVVVRDVKGSNGTSYCKFYNSTWTLNIQKRSWKTILAGGWTNPFEKYARQNEFIFPNIGGEHKKQK